MSIRLAVFVGPYLEVVAPKEKLNDLLDKLIELDEPLMDGRGNQNPGDTLALIPNKTLADCDRTSFFVSGGAMQEVDGGELVLEKASLGKLAAPFTAYLQELGLTFAIRWGVVSGWF